MNYMVIEKWIALDCPYVLADEDGIVQLFETEELAQETANEECHDGIVVPYN